MDYACPLCSVNLKHRRLAKAPVDGVALALSYRWYLRCPACGGALAVNPHAAEKAFFPGVLVAIVGLNLYSLNTGYKISITGAVVMLGLVFLAAYVIRNLVPPRDWPRYVACKLPPRQ